MIRVNAYVDLAKFLRHAIIYETPCRYYAEETLQELAKFFPEEERFDALFEIYSELLELYQEQKTLTLTRLHETIDDRLIVFSEEDREDIESVFSTGLLQ